MRHGPLWRNLGSEPQSWELFVVVVVLVVVAAVVSGLDVGAPPLFPSHPIMLPASPLEVFEESHGSEKSDWPRDLKIFSLSSGVSTISTSKHVE